MNSYLAYKIILISRGKFKITKEISFFQFDISPLRLKFHKTTLVNKQDQGLPPVFSFAIQFFVVWHQLVMGRGVK